MSEAALQSLTGGNGALTWAYVDGAGDEPVPTREARRRTVRDALADAGAPDADIAAIDAALEDAGGVPSPSARYLAVRGGALIVDEHFSGERLGPEELGHGPLAPLLPLLRHRSADLLYLVVETTRDGADLRLERAGRSREVSAESIEGRTDTLTKVRTGGWSHRRFHARAEETWKHNQSEVADAVDRIVRERHPRFVAISGDVRARQLLIEQLGPTSRDRVVEVDANTRADGADDDALLAAVSETAEHLLDDAVSAARDRAAAGDRESGARGTAEVVAALQQSQVDTLVLDNRLLEADDTILALDAEPWVAIRDDDGLTAGTVATASVAEALARAAVLTGAEVLVAEERTEVGEERDERVPEPPVALLRWPAAAG